MAVISKVLGQFLIQAISMTVLVIALSNPPGRLTQRRLAGLAHQLAGDF
ncbi:hypothetical protein I551_9058 [Mycobacterium ulcerans str. Harvey]|uniref:Uncharacterized protein n=1 Tax=Mycobacterium ulcerans str. Harvey TaxID=1299332 RepID=A0ABN0R940_MYCUL|nr:hypothetical protein I551_9058 [Mycobacterium ulcerans str. Harvey]